MQFLRRSLAHVSLVGILATGALVGAQAQTVNSTSKEITALLQRMSADWSNGDLQTFATGYKNSPDILFVGKKLERGYSGMLEGYRKQFPTREKMGTLQFSQLEVQPLDASFATCTGRFHLERTLAGGGVGDGYFLLVLEKTSDGWKIIRDDSTLVPTMKP